MADEQGSDQERRQRAITDEDAKAIARALKTEMVTTFYRDLGKGVWGMVWRGLILAAIAIAFYGAGKDVIDAIKNVP